MPDLDGFELMAQLKARFPALDVILMTGSVDDLDDKLVRAIRSAAFYFIQKPFDREVLRTLVERCVELRWRREDHRQNLKRLETEMAEARAFQQSLLPDREAIVNRVAVCCRYTPCSALGGDLYDYAAAAAGRTALLIADVSGHGVSAAMLTGIVKSAFHASHVDGFEPSAVVQRVSTGTRGLQPRSIRHAGRGADLSRRAPAAVCECRSSADRSVGKRARTAVAREHRAAGLAGADQRQRGTHRSCPWTRAITCCSTPDGVWETLADDDGRAEERFTSIIDRASEGGAPLLDAILADVHQELAGRPQPDDLTLLTATVRSLGE